MMANTYDIGDVVRCSVAFTDAAGTAVDPGGVRVKIKSPLGVETVYLYGGDPEVIREGTGSYYINVEPDREGVWVYRFEGLATNKGAGEATFTIRDSAFY